MRPQVFCWVSFIAQALKIDSAVTPCLRDFNITFTQSPHTTFEVLINASLYKPLKRVWFGWCGTFPPIRVASPFSCWVPHYLHHYVQSELSSIHRAYLFSKDNFECIELKLFFNFLLCILKIPLYLWVFFIGLAQLWVIQVSIETWESWYFSSFAASSCKIGGFLRLMPSFMTIKKTNSHRAI